MKLTVYLIGVGMIFASLLIGQTPQPKDEGVQQGVEVQARGPIHEAFAQPGLQTQKASSLVKKKPPEPINELPPEQKPEGDHMQWIPGYWAWDDERADFLWVSGIWRVPPPGRMWVPGYWSEDQGGWRWISGYWGSQAQTSVELLPPPPEPVDEAIPPPASADQVYIPGDWVYRTNNYYWRPGFWMAGQPGWVWCPGHYWWTPRGYISVPGYWDYDLQNRGLAFAPVYFNPSVYGQSGFYYRPTYAISPGFLLSSLFVRLGAGQYYFGNYYDPFYAQRGYAPWVDYRVRGGAYDPLYSYYRWQNRGNAGWEQQLRATYAARRTDKAQRPPATLAQQIKTGSKASVQAVTPLTQLKPTAFKLEAVPKARVDEIRKDAQKWREFSKQRQKIESDAKFVTPKGKPATPKGNLKFDLPKSPIPPPAAKKGPPDPVQPKALPKPPTPKKGPEKKGKDKKGKGNDLVILDGRPMATIARVDTPWPSDFPVDAAWRRHR